MIIRAICVLIEVFLFYLLQTSVFPGIALAGVVPDLLIIVVCSVGIMRGRIPGMLTGIVCGLMIDCTYSEFMGIFGLMYLVIGYFSGYSRKIYDQDDYTIPLVIIGVGELIYNILYYSVFYLLKGNLNIGFFLYRFMIPRVVYTLLISILIYKLMNICNVFLMRFDRE